VRFFIHFSLKTYYHYLYAKHRYKARIKVDMKKLSTSLLDDPELLELMFDYVKNAKSIYQPGPYWRLKTVNAFRELKEVGISGFRGDLNGAASSYGDNPLIDLRCLSNYGIRSIFTKIFKYVYPFNKFFNSQVRIARNYFEELNLYKTEYLKTRDRVKDLFLRYKIPSETTKGGCLAKGNFDGKVVSHHYLQLLDTLDQVNQTMNISNKRSMMEIGGGFGINVHLIIELFPNIRKIIYLDIPPNLYVGTQYLKSFYGNSVIDFKKSGPMEVIQFSENDELEIFCIVPSQIEKVISEVDFFYNAHSFVEMPEEVVRNYAHHIERILKKEVGVISMVSYDGFNSSTIDPDFLPKFFNFDFNKTIVPTLTPGRFNYHFISN
jgi:putative sugar O-methyltransferase